MNSITKSLAVNLNLFCLRYWTKLRCDEILSSEYLTKSSVSQDVNHDLESKQISIQPSIEASNKQKGLVEINDEFIGMECI